MALPKKKIKSDRPSNPIKKKETPKAPALKNVFKNPLKKNSGKVSEIPKIDEFRGEPANSPRRRNSRIPIARKRSLNKRDMV